MKIFSKQSQPTKRLKIAQEMVSVEADYTKGLSFLLEMKSQVQRINVCSQDDINIMFPNFDEFHQLRSEFHARIKDDFSQLEKDENHLIGETYNKMFFRPEFAGAYTKFGKSYTLMEQTFNKLLENNDRFRQLDNEHGSKNYKFYCISPVQRLPRYGLLIKQLIKETHPSHDDHEYFLKAERQVALIAEKMNREVAAAKLETLKRDITEVVVNIFEEDLMDLVNEEERQSLQYIRQEAIQYQDPNKGIVLKALKTSRLEVLARTFYRFYRL